MKKAVNILIIAVSVVLLVMIGFMSYTSVAFPTREAKALPEVNIKPDSALIARGSYLAHVTGGCIHCHSTVKEGYHILQTVPGTEGAGGQLWSAEMGLPGDFYSRNITPYNLGDWSDAEIYRAITAGVSKDGSPLFPMMPYHYFGHFDHSDVEAIIAYIRTLRPIENDVPPDRPVAIMRYVMRMMPQAPDEMKRPGDDDSLALGHYLTAISCADCHTPFEKGKPVMSKTFYGGREFPSPDGKIVSSANLTPDLATGIGAWTVDQFVQKFRYYATPAARSLTGEEAGFYSPMPWADFSGMKENELRAIYYYLHSLSPVENKVIKVREAPEM